MIAAILQLLLSFGSIETLLPARDETLPVLLSTARILTPRSFDYSPVSVLAVLQDTGWSSFHSELAVKTFGCCGSLPGRCCAWAFFVDSWWLPPSSSLCYLYILLVPIFFTKGIIFISRLFFLGSNELKLTLDSNCMSIFYLICVPRYLGKTSEMILGFSEEKGLVLFHSKIAVLLLWVIAGCCYCIFLTSV